MRIATEASVLETGGALSVRRSTIKTSRKTFRMHIDSQYSDKIGAPVRELAANAFDSHLRAGQDRPFYIHCPNVLDPRFFVRDFGVGMTDAIMGDVYIVLGESDKETTDDEVGMWGLGSKSPFAYSDQYNITCYDGETARHYGYGIAEDGVPNLYLMDQEPSSEPRGVSVGFAVESRDFEAFRRAIEIVGIGHNGAFESNVKLPALGAIAFQGEGWTAYQDVDQPLGSTSRWYARQGCVIYPITAKEVERPNDYQTKLTYILDCPIGTIRVTPSRESIEYKPEVIDYLNERIKLVKDEVTAAIVEAVKDIKSVAEFFATVEKIKPSFINNTFTHPGTGLTSALIKPEWPTFFFEPKVQHSRWEFAKPASVGLTAKKVETYKRIYVMADISALYDPSRGTEKSIDLSRSEFRRVSRFTRAFLEGRSETAALFVMNCDWNADYREACFPGTEFVDLDFEALRDAVPQRVTPPKSESKPPIRGLALAKAAGEQKPVFEIKADEARVAWVSSEQYRRQSASLFKLAKRFDIDMLYIAAPAVQYEMVDAKIPHLREAIDTGLAVHGLTFADWYFAKDRLNSHDVKGYVGFLRALAVEAPKAYDKLAETPQEFGVIAKAVRRLLEGAEVIQLTEEEKKALDCLTLNDAGEVMKPEVPADMAGFDTAVKAVANLGYSNPTCAWVRGLTSVKDKDKLERAAKCLVQLQRIIPPSEKF